MINRLVLDLGCRRFPLLCTYTVNNNVTLVLFSFYYVFFTIKFTFVVSLCGFRGDFGIYVAF